MTKPFCSNCREAQRRERGCTTCARIESEKKWIRKFVRKVIQDGGHVAVDYGDGDALVYMSAERSIMSLVHACDEEYLRVRLGDGKLSHVYCVYGNADDGSEVFADWGLRCEPTLIAIGYTEA